MVGSFQWYVAVSTTDVGHLNTAGYSLNCCMFVDGALNKMVYGQYPAETSTLCSFDEEYLVFYSSTSFENGNVINPLSDYVYGAAENQPGYSFEWWGTGATNPWTQLAGGPGGLATEVTNGDSVAANLGLMVQWWDHDLDINITPAAGASINPTHNQTWTANTEVAVWFGAESLGQVISNPPSSPNSAQFYASNESVPTYTFVWGTGWSGPTYPEFFKAKVGSSSGSSSSSSISKSDDGPVVGRVLGTRASSWAPSPSTPILDLDNLQPAYQYSLQLGATLSPVFVKRFISIKFHDYSYDVLHGLDHTQYTIIFIGKDGGPELVKHVGEFIDGKRYLITGPNTREPLGYDVRIVGVLPTTSLRTQQYNALVHVQKELAALKASKK